MNNQVKNALKDFIDGSSHAAAIKVIRDNLRNASGGQWGWEYPGRVVLFDSHNTTVFRSNPDRDGWTDEQVCANAALACTSKKMALLIAELLEDPELQEYWEAHAES